MEEEHRQSVVAQWNEVMLEAIRAGSARPTATAYQLYATSAAVYDAWAAYDEAAFGVYSDLSGVAGEATEAAKFEAVSYAAHAALSRLLPGQEARFDDFLASLGLAEIDLETALLDPSSPAAIGLLAAEGVFAARAGDGSNFENGFASTGDYVPVNSADPDAPNAVGGPDFDPNRWTPLRVPTGAVVDEDGVAIATDDPASYTDQPPLTPHWGTVTPFALLSGDQFRPPAPPALGDMSDYVDGLGNLTTRDQAYRDQFTEVLEISGSLTDEQKAIAEFWADGPRTESPPGHWNQFAQDIAKREGHGIDDDAKLFLALNAALLDASIAVWETKYHYDSARPQTAIRFLYEGQEVEAWAGPNRGTQTIPGETWQPYQNVTFITPPFPEYVSGHSTFSSAAADVIAAYVGSDQFYDGVTLGNYDLNGDGEIDLLGEFVALELVFEDYDGPPIPLRWTTLTEAAEEAGISRLYGGIHMQDGNLRGQELGGRIGATAFEVAQAFFTRGGDDEIAVGPEGGRVVAGPGDDSIVFAEAVRARVEGGPGTDSVTLPGGLADWTATPGGAGFAFAGPDGVVVEATGVEGFVFDDGALEAASGGGVEELFFVYRLAFQRAGDAAGLAFWQDAQEGGLGLAAIAELFAASPEFAALFPEGTGGAFVGALYAEGLGRAADEAGAAFWTELLAGGGATPGDVLAAFAASDEMGQVRADEVAEGVLLLV